MVLAVDKGTTYTKTNKKWCCRSTVKKLTDDDVLIDEEDIFELDGQCYIVGQGGNYSTDLMKQDHENTKILELYAIANTCRYESYVNTDLITGLPIAYYSKNKEKMKELFHNTKNTVKLGKRKQVIFINQCEVFPESAGAYYSQSEYKTLLIIDIGGLSIDVSLFVNGKLIKSKTYPLGVMKLYSDIYNTINSQYDIDKDIWDIEEVLKEGLFINGIKVDIKCNNFIKLHTDKIIRKLKIDFDLKSQRNICLVGGGSEVLEPYFRKYIPHIFMLENYFYANAIGYGNVGGMIF